MAEHGRRKARRGKHLIDPERAAQDMDRQGPSPGDPIDERVIHSRKSDWVEKSSPAAGDEVSEDELKAFDLLGRAGVRDDAIAGVGDAGGLSTPASGATPGAVRRNPPLEPLPDEADVPPGAGGGGASGGVSGGARGAAGSSNRGAGSAGRNTDQAARRGPAELDAGSRFDYDAPDDTVGEDDER